MYTHPSSYYTSPLSWSRWLLGAAAACLLIVTTAAPVSAASIKGDFKRIGKLPKAHTLKQVEVVEFINFTCSHCHQFRISVKPLLRKYGKRVKLVSVPIAFSGQSDAPIRLYFIAERLGKGERTLNAIFQATFTSQLNINDPRIVQQLAQGLGLRKAYAQQRNATWLNKKIQASIQQASKADVNATPTLVLQHSIRIQPKTSISQFIRRLDNLLQQLLT